MDGEHQPLLSTPAARKHDEQQQHTAEPGVQPPAASTQVNKLSPHDDPSLIAPGVVRCYPSSEPTGRTPIYECKHCRNTKYEFRGVLDAVTAHESTCALLSPLWLLPLYEHVVVGSLWTWVLRTATERSKFSSAEVKARVKQAAFESPERPAIRLRLALAFIQLLDLVRRAQHFSSVIQYALNALPRWQAIRTTVR